MKNVKNMRPVFYFSIVKSPHRPWNQKLFNLPKTPSGKVEPYFAFKNNSPVSNFEFFIENSIATFSPLFRRILFFSRLFVINQQLVNRLISQKVVFNLKLN